MRTDARAARAVDQLATLLRSDQIPQSVRSLGAQAQLRLAEPIHLCIVGRAEANPVALANALVGGAGGRVLPEIAGMPPATVAYGPSDTWHVVLSDGETQETHQDEFATLNPYGIALLRRWVPLPVLENVSLRVVTLEGAPKEIAAAMRWATREADMVLWCAEDAAADSTLYTHLPEALQDHAFLAVRSGAAIERAEFVACHAVPDGVQDVSLRDLRDALLAHISRGRREDIDCAVMLLEQYLPRQGAGARSTPEVGDDGVAPEPVAEVVPLPSPSGLDTTADTAEADRVRAIVGALIEQGQGLEAALGDAGPVPVDALLDMCSDALSAAAATAAGQSGTLDPDLAETLAEAADLMLLIQLEGSASALVDSLALMLQARHACEERLCA
ncbi:MAG: hypothetical protein AAGB05_06520 [Pseudomonadota bacterium]